MMLPSYPAIRLTVEVRTEVHRADALESATARGLELGIHNKFRNLQGSPRFLFFWSISCWCMYLDPEFWRTLHNSLILLNTFRFKYNNLSSISQVVIHLSSCNQTFPWIPPSFLYPGRAFDETLATPGVLLASIQPVESTETMVVGVQFDFFWTDLFHHPFENLEQWDSKNKTSSLIL